MKQFAVMHPAAVASVHGITKNSPLARMIEEASSPIHAMRTAKAFQIKAPKIAAIHQVSPVANDPWLTMKARVK